MISLSEILHTIAQALMIPCLIILIILMAGAVWQIGDIVVEYIAERRKHKCNVPQLLRDVHAAGADGLAELIENSGLLRRQKKALLELAESRGLPKDTLTALAERLLATEEARNARTTSITDMIAKLGPMFGLLGTLIPLGPGIVALGQGDTVTLSESMNVAFDTTIAGVISAAVASVISHIRKRWYNDDKTIDIGAQGLNGWLWGLITLDSMKYNIPAGSSYTRTEMIKRILSFQLPDNGFNLRFAQGSTADPDITAMAIQALAPYYRNSTFNVKDPVDKALDCLSKLQLDTGDFRSWGTRNSESVSQIIVSLCSIGVDPQNDSRFIKNGINLLDALFYYQQEDGGFAHSYESDPGNPSAIPGESNSIATDQALLALVAVWRQTQGMSILYDFRPGSVSAKILTPEESEVSFAGSYEFTEADQQQADALPKKLSTENDAEVTALLDKLKMSRDFEGYDTYMTKLTQAKSDIDALYAEIESINADIESQIVPMTDPGLGEKSTVDRLVKRYKALSDHDKELIQNWDAVLAVKVQTDAAQRDLFLIIGGVVVVMVAVTVVVRRRRESQ